MVIFFPLLESTNGDQTRRCAPRKTRIKARVDRRRVDARARVARECVQRQNNGHDVDNCMEVESAGGKVRNPERACSGKMAFNKII